MRLIEGCRISRFRSIRDLAIENLGDFSALAGLNNAGKSNVLRALNAFFLDQVEPGVSLDFSRDFFRAELPSKKKKRISIEVTFNLPDHFRFRNDLSRVQQLVGKRVTVRKEWGSKESLPVFFLNRSQASVSLDEENRIRQFLSLISFRYIPNRVVPVDVIRNEHEALRDALVRRLARKAPDQGKVFEQIRQTSVELIKRMGRHFVDSFQGVDSIRLRTPESWAELLFALGYQLSERSVETEDFLQGSGVQAFLMFETLSLIDRDYFQQFGWRQAAVWAVEEPESSLHASLSAQLGAFLRDVVSGPENRLQVLATTHSEHILQYSDSPLFLQRKDGATVVHAERKVESILELSSQAGVSTWVHPLLYSPHLPLLLVEGRFDVALIQEAFRILGLSGSLMIRCIGQLAGVEADSGVERMLNYLKEHKRTLRVRDGLGPVVVLLDWEEERRKASFERVLEGCMNSFVELWPIGAANPNLGPTFRGIERFSSDRMIDEAEKRGARILRDGKGMREVHPSEYERVKQRVHDIVSEGLDRSDLRYISEPLKAIHSRTRIQ